MYSVNNIAGLSEFMYVIMGIGVVIGFAVVCLSMYMAVLQRTREIGILKALGGSNGFILRIILAEAMVLGIGGTVLGILMSFGAWWLIRTFVPSSLPMIIVPYMVAHRRRHHPGGRGAGRAVPGIERRPARSHRGPGV
jgi:putative ABC transport system permease protein